MNDLQNGVSDRETALQSFEVTVSYHIRRRGSETGKYETLDAKDSCIFDNGRIRCEELADIPGNAVTTRRALAVFNGNEMRLLEGEAPKAGLEKALWAHGRVAKQTGVFAWQMNPLDLFLCDHGVKFSLRLQDTSCRIVGMSHWEGRSVVELEWGPFASANQVTKGVYLIDPTCGFALVRQGSFIRFPPDTKWLEYAKIETFDYVEIAPGISVPRRAFREFSNVTVDCVTRGFAPELYWRGDIHFTDWRLHPGTSEELFTLHFPGGISVDDEIVGKSYISARIRDQTLADHITAAQAISARGRPLVFYLSLGISIVLVVILAVRCVTKHRSPLETDL